jgi:uncharacterized delta-60 repeat protein
MKASKMIVHARDVVEAEMANLRGRRMRDALLDNRTPRRVWMEALEARRMLSYGFGVDGWTSAAFGIPIGSAVPIAMAAAPDGKVYVVGDASASSDNWGIARFNIDGTPDTSFGSAGTGAEIFSLGQWSMADHVLVQPDGKIIVTGECDNGLSIARFNQDGSLDTTFAGGARVYDVFTSPAYLIGAGGLWLTREGKVMMMAQSGPDIVTMRLRSDGSVDKSFAPAGVVSAPVDAAGDPVGGDTLLAARRLPGGGVVAYVDLWNYPPDPANPGAVNVDAYPIPQLVRVQLDDQGQVISQKAVQVRVQPPTGWPDYMVSLAPDGSAYFSADAPDPRVEKLDPSGNVDVGFGDHGLANVPRQYVQIEALTADGRIIVNCGVDDDLTPSEQDIMLNADGSIDTSFNGGQLFGAGRDYTVLPLEDGSLILAYASGERASVNPSIRLEKFLADGSVAPSASGIDLTALGAALDAANKAANSPFAPDDNWSFADAPGSTVWDPDGQKDVWDDGSGAI